MDRLVLSIVIIFSTSLCISCSVLIWCKQVKKGLKMTLVYLMSIVLIYQTSTILAFYAPVEFFEFLIYLKIISAFLLKTAILIYVAVAMEKKTLIKLFLILHISSFVFVFLFYFETFRQAIVTISGTSAIYGVGSKVYTFISSFIYISAGILFYNADDFFKKKKRYLIFLLFFILLNVIILFMANLSSGEVLYEKMHIYILLILLAFFLKSTPFFDKKDTLISAANIMEGTDESIIIFDKQNRVGYIHNVFQDIALDNCLDQIVNQIETENNNYNCSEVDDQTNNLITGETVLTAGEKKHLHYKLAPLFHRGVYIGKIMVLRDISYFKRLFKELQNKNILLRQAVKKEKEYLQATRKLSSEEERARILGLVNNIAGEYLKHLKAEVERMDYKTDLSQQTEIKEKHELLLSLTRKTIANIRQMVKRLHSSEKIGEV